MSFLLDTDTCVFWLRGRASVRGRVAAVGIEALQISIITLAELRYGAAHSTRPEANHAAIDSFTRPITVIGLDPAIARTFGDLKAELRQQGMLIDDFDLLVAATARVHDLTVVTNNVGHFGRIPDLRLEQWA